MRTLLALWLVTITAIYAADKPVEITALDLTKDYSTLKKDFDAKWKDKVVIVTGVVQLAKSTGKINDAHQIMIIGYKGKDDPVAIGVRFPWSKDYENLKAGDTVKVEGKVGPYSDSLYAVVLSEVKPFK